MQTPPWALPPRDRADGIGGPVSADSEQEGSRVTCVGPAPPLEVNRSVKEIREGRREQFSAWRGHATPAGLRRKGTQATTRPQS